MSDRVKLLFIGGCGRSGSTLLGDVLGSTEGYGHVGELRFLWRRGVIENWICGCGARFAECAVWQRILDQACGGMDRELALRMHAFAQQYGRTWNLPALLRPSGQRRMKKRLQPYLEQLEGLYRSIRDQVPAEVVVDSSGMPPYLLTLDMLPSLDIRVVHLVRDPRGILYSMRRKKTFPDTGDDMAKYALPLESFPVWSSWNISLEGWGKRHPHRYLRVRYEDFAAQPQATVARILELCGTPEAVPPFMNDGRANLSVGHSVSGNPSRFDRGPVRIRLDDEWRTKGWRRDHFSAACILWPLLRRYGYPVRIKGPHRVSP